jgi:ABC-type multidrug transport system fused ATPase/permease subunit
MEQAFSKAEELAQHLKEYADNRVDQIKLSSAGKTAKLMSYMIAVLVVVMFIIFFLLFAAVALSIFMGEVFGTMYWGFLFTGGLLLLLAAITWVFRKAILEFPIMNALIQQLFTKMEAEDEDD